MKGTIIIIIMLLCFVSASHVSIPLFPLFLIGRSRAYQYLYTALGRRVGARAFVCQVWVPSTSVAEDGAQLFQLVLLR